MTTRRLANEYELDDDPARIDVDAACRYLGDESYWASGRSHDVTSELIRTAARVVGAYAPDGSMVGFARVVSDLYTVAYLADVYVLESHRGLGLGLELVRMTVEDAPFEHVRWLLGTRDAHDLYRRLGFEDPTSSIMERPRSKPQGAPLRSG